jgi:D-hexose-6-phosphate mutarotase
MPYLAVALEVVNTGTKQMRFNIALHIYLRVENTHTARQMVIPGERAGMSVPEPIDFVHYDLNGPLQLRTGLGRLDIASTGFTDRLVWNPNPNVGVNLAPGNQWVASQTMRWSPAKAVVSPQTGPRSCP